MPGQKKSFQTRAQTAVKRFTRTPGYHARLPFVFPYFKNVSMDEAQSLIACMTMPMVREEPGVEALWFALTGHPRTRDGHVTLWLSSDAAHYLLTEELVKDVSQYEVES